MNDDFYGGEKKGKHIQDLNIVPILDMFIAIIFFLLLSTSMIALTKQVIPPSASKAVTGESSSLPVSPKLFVVGSIDKMSAVMKWEGAKPGTLKIDINPEFMTKPKLVIDDIKKMIGDFKKDYPNEKTIQVALKSDLPYQVLISVMDGVRDFLPDVVLTSYQSAESMQE